MSDKEPIFDPESENESNGNNENINSPSQSVFSESDCESQI